MQKIIPEIPMSQRLTFMLIMALRKYRDDNAAIYAAAIAYAALAAAFPLILILLVIVSPFLQPPVDVERLASRLLNLPGTGDFLSSNIIAVYERRASLGLTSSLGAVLGALGLFAAFESALNRVWGIQGRGWIKGRLVVFIALIAFALILVVLMALAIWGVRSASQAGLRTNSPIYGPTLLAIVAPPLIDFVLFFFAYKFLPNVRVPTHAAVIGSITATVLAEFTFGALSWYLGSLADYHQMYNTAGAVFALLAWLYALATVFLFGAEVSAIYRSKSSPE
jgi:membrane protein